MNLYQSLMEFHPDPVYTLDVQGRITNLNSAAEQFSEYTRDELLGMSLQDVVPAEIHDELAGHFLKALNGQSQCYVGTCRHDDSRLLT